MGGEGGNLFTVEYTHNLVEGRIRAEDFQTVLRAAGENETRQEIFQDRFQLYKRDPKY
jgi:hypothetical protein